MILVLGIGSILRGDDAFGVRVAEELQSRTLPDRVKVIVAELRAMDHLDEIQQAERVILIDAMDGGRRAGEVILFTPDQVRSLDTDASPHGVGVLGILKLLETLGHCPPTTVVGCQRGNVMEGDVLSADVAAAVTVAADAVERMLRNNEGA